MSESVKSAKNAAVATEEVVVEATANVAESVTAMVKCVNLSKEFGKVSLFLNKDVPTHVVNEETGEFEETMGKYIGFHISALTAQLCNVDDDIAMFRAALGKFTQAHFGIVLSNAEITYSSQLVKEGEEFEDYEGNMQVADHDMYLRTITKVKVTPRAKQIMDSAVTAALLKGLD